MILKSSMAAASYIGSIQVGIEIDVMGPLKILAHMMRLMCRLRVREMCVGCNEAEQLKQHETCGP
jgi:hypothetical protein